MVTASDMRTDLPKRKFVETSCHRATALTSAALAALAIVAGAVAASQCARQRHRKSGGARGSEHQTWQRLPASQHGSLTYASGPMATNSDVGSTRARWRLLSMLVRGRPRRWCRSPDFGSLQLSSGRRSAGRRDHPHSA